MTHANTAQRETAEQFLHGYAKRARMTVDQVLFERNIVPCDPDDCGYEGCTGWRAEPKLIVVDVTAWVYDQRRGKWRGPSAVSMPQNEENPHLGGG